MWTKNDTESTELKANLKTKVATVATVWEEKKSAVKEVEAAVLSKKKAETKAAETSEKKAETKAATWKRETETTVAQSQRKSTKEQQTQKASDLTFTF